MLDALAEAGFQDGGAISLRRWSDVIVMDAWPVLTDEQMGQVLAG